MRGFFADRPNSEGPLDSAPSEISTQRLGCALPGALYVKLSSDRLTHFLHINRDFLLFSATHRVNIATRESGEAT